MTALQDRVYEEALALWRSVSDAPPPPGDAHAVLEAALRASGIAAYDRLATPYLDDRALTWAVYRRSPPGLA